MTMWLPRRRIPKDRSEPGSCRFGGRSLPNLYLDPGDKHVVAQAALDFARVGGFQEELECPNEVRASFFDHIALARNIQLSAESEVAGSLPLDNCRELACLAQI